MPNRNDYRYIFFSLSINKCVYVCVCLSWVGLGFSRGGQNVPFCVCVKIEMMNKCVECLMESINSILFDCVAVAVVVQELQRMTNASLICGF